MIDIPLGKALVPKRIKGRKVEDRCLGCFLFQANVFGKDVCMVHNLACQYDRREDGENIIFELVDHRH